MIGQITRSWWNLGHEERYLRIVKLIKSPFSAHLDRFYSQGEIEKSLLQLTR